jgi:hypothetical protein
MCYQIYVDDILFINMMLKERVSLWLWESFAVLVNVLLYGSGVVLQRSHLQVFLVNPTMKLC